jgi:hypothetical protein
MTIKTYKGNGTDLYAFLTFSQIGHILAGKPTDFDKNGTRQTNAGVDWFEEGTETEAEAAVAAGKPFEPNAACGITTRTEFGQEVVLCGAYSGTSSDFDAHAVQSDMEENQGLRYMDFNDRTKYFAGVVEEQAHAYGVYRDKLCCEVSCLFHELKEIEDNHID